MAQKINVGLGQASRLAQLGPKERQALIAEGLPIVFESASSFLRASKALPEHRREADILAASAEEEAAKALILIDMVRCPPKLVSDRIGSMTKWFYRHLARMIYAEACDWRPMHVTQLQEYADRQRKTHFVDGEYGEYIFPNNQLFTRESLLYADVATHEDGVLYWSVPAGRSRMRFQRDPSSYVTAEALAAVGAFTSEGLSVVAETWGGVEFRDTTGAQESDRLIHKMLDELIRRNVPLAHATKDHASALYAYWQFPMYNLDLSPIEVTMEEIERERDALLPREW